MEKVLIHNEFENVAVNLEQKVENEIFGEKVGLFTRVFGCHHPRMSKPVTLQNITYRFCPSCGIRRRYNLEKFRSEGAFYYPSKNKELHHI